MISKEELDKIAEEKTGLSDRLFVGFKVGFREAEKIYLKKIAELELKLAEVNKLAKQALGFMGIKNEGEK